MVLEKILENPLVCQEIKPVNPKGNQSWIFMEGLMLKLKLQHFCHLIQRTDSLENILMLRKSKGKRIRVTEDEIFGWHHRLNVHEFEQTPGDSEGQGGLACCSPWDQKVRHDWATYQQQKPSYKRNHMLHTLFTSLIQPNVLTFFHDVPHHVYNVSTPLSICY